MSWGTVFQSSCGCTMNTAGEVLHHSWCALRGTSSPDNFPVHPLPTWLSCPECQSVYIRTIAMGNAECSNGHRYPVPGGPIAFWAEIRLEVPDP